MITIRLEKSRIKVKYDENPKFKILHFLEIKLLKDVGSLNKISFFQPKWILENDYDLYSAGSNPTSVESYAVLLAEGLIG